MSVNYQQLSKELYEVLKKFRNSFMTSEIDNVLQKYEQEVNRDLDRTAVLIVLYLKCITEALENPGMTVEFIDNYPHTWDLAKSHESNLRYIIEKLGYDIVVQTKGKAQVYLYHRFGI